eukprot:11284090-Alexandrium_andersonii.AAC.1
MRHATVGFGNVNARSRASEERDFLVILACMIQGACDAGLSVNCERLPLERLTAPTPAVAGS